MSGKVINVAVLGIGFSATVFHIPYIVRIHLFSYCPELTRFRQLSLPDLYRLHSIYERRATATESKARTLFGDLGVKVFSDLDETLADSEVDLVCLCALKTIHVC